MQHPVRAALFGGLAALSVAGLAGVAQAQSFAHSRADHVITLALPGGGEAQVAYVGDTPPHLVAFTPAPLSADPFVLMRTAFGPASPFTSPFAALDAAMQRATTAMLQQADMLARMPGFVTPGGGLTRASLPAGSGVCVQSMSVTYLGNGSVPRVVRRQAGDCGASPAPAVTASPSYRPVRPARPAGTILVRGTAPTAQPRLQEAVYWHPVSVPPSR